MSSFSHLMRSRATTPVILGGCWSSLQKIPIYVWVFPKIGIPQNGWFIKENPIKMDDLGGTTIFGNIHIQYPIRNASSPASLLLLPRYAYQIRAHISPLFWFAGYPDCLMMASNVDMRISRGGLIVGGSTKKDDICCFLLLMEEILHHLGCIKPWK